MSYTPYSSYTTDFGWPTIQFSSLAQAQPGTRSIRLVTAWFMLHAVVGLPHRHVGWPEHGTIS